MVPSNFPQSNDCLSPPEGVDLDDCSVLSVWRGTVDRQPVVISCWKPTKEELDEINKTGRIWLWIWGTTMPPAALTGSDPFGGVNG